MPSIVSPKQLQWIKDFGKAQKIAAGQPKVRGLLAAPSSKPTIASRNARNRARGAKFAMYETPDTYLFDRERRGAGQLPKGHRAFAAGYERERVNKILNAHVFNTPGALRRGSEASRFPLATPHGGSTGAKFQPVPKGRGIAGRFSAITPELLKDYSGAGKVLEVTRQGGTLTKGRATVIRALSKYLRWRDA